MEHSETPRDLLGAGAIGPGRCVSDVRLRNSCLDTGVLVDMKQAGPQPDPTLGTRIGYTRVSTVAQTLDQQNEALATAGVTKTFSDTMSVPVTTDRPGRPPGLCP
jgi:hypothetical protein